MLVVTNPPASAGDQRDVGLIPGSKKSSREENGNSLQCSCLDNPMARGAVRLPSVGWRRAGHDGESEHSALSGSATPPGTRVWETRWGGCLLSASCRLLILRLETKQSLVGGCSPAGIWMSLQIKPHPVLSCCPQVNDPALRGGGLFPSQLPGMDMIKQEGDASRVRNNREINPWLWIVHRLELAQTCCQPVDWGETCNMDFPSSPVAKTLPFQGRSYMLCNASKKGGI